MISIVIIGQKKGFRREKKIFFFKNDTSRFGDFKIPLGNYKVKIFVITLINLTEPNLFIDDITVRTRLNREKF